MRKYPLAAFLILTFAITWLLITPLVLDAQHLLSTQISQHWHFLGALGPIIGAIVVTREAGGKPGLAEFVDRIRYWRSEWVWLLLAVLSPMVLFVSSAVIVRLLGKPWPAFERLASEEYGNIGWLFGSVLSAIAYGFGEEAGWRGFALPRLQDSRSAMSATFILSVFWAIWHAPMFFYRFEFGVGQAVGFFVGLFAGGIWLTFLYNSTGGSILAVAVWHTVWNIVNIVGLIIAVDVVSAMSTLVMLTAIVVVVVWRPALLSMNRKHTISDTNTATDASAA